MRETLSPANQTEWLAMRAIDVTSTESPALFGESTYDTEFSLWHRKREGAIVALEPTERMEWGTDLQDQIAASLAKRQQVSIERLTEYARLSNTRMGASFDFRIFGAGGHGVELPPALAAKFYECGPGLLEIKNVDAAVFAKTWPKRDDGTLEAPSHIEIQLQHQLHVSGLKWGAIGVLVGGNRGHLLIRDYYQDVGEEIESRIVKFWQSIESDQPPDPTYPPDAGLMIKLMGNVTPEKVYDGRGNEALRLLLDDYKRFAEQEKLAKEDKQICHAKILQMIGDAQRAYADGYMISAGMVKATRIEYDRAAYRLFKVTEKKS